MFMSSFNVSYFFYFYFQMRKRIKREREREELVCTVTVRILTDSKQRVEPQLVKVLTHRSAVAVIEGLAKGMNGKEKAFLHSFLIIII